MRFFSLVHPKRISGSATSLQLTLLPDGGTVVSEQAMKPQPQGRLLQSLKAWKDWLAILFCNCPDCSYAVRPSRTRRPDTAREALEQQYPFLGSF